MRNTTWFWFGLITCLAVSAWLCTNPEVQSVLLAGIVATSAVSAITLNVDNATAKQEEKRTALEYLVDNVPAGITLYHSEHHWEWWQDGERRGISHSLHSLLEMKVAVECMHFYPGFGFEKFQESRQQFLQEGPDACHVPPAGWYCTREKGHDGPCAAVPVEDGKPKFGEPL